MQYQHPEYGVVTALAWFSSHVNVQTVQGIRPVQSSDLTVVDQPNSPAVSVEAEVEAEAAVSALATASRFDLTEPKDEAKQSDPNLVNLNTSSTNQLSRALPFIGSKRAKLIVANRPEGAGYRSWEQFRELNPNLLEDRKSVV